jgi:hypothetical protein
MLSFQYLRRPGRAAKLLYFPYSWRIRIPSAPPILSFGCVDGMAHSSQRFISFSAAFRPACTVALAFAVAMADCVQTTPG